MSKYLVVDFNRYDTNQSTHVHVEADSPFDAFIKTQDEDLGLDGIEFYRELFQSVDEIFSCIPLEENDILIYLV